MNHQGRCYSLATQCLPGLLYSRQSCVQLKKKDHNSQQFTLSREKWLLAAETGSGSPLAVLGRDSAG